MPVITGEVLLGRSPVYSIPIFFLKKKIKLGIEGDLHHPRDREAKAKALITRLSLDPALPKEMKYELDRQSYSAYHHLLTLTFTDLGSSISWDL